MRNRERERRERGRKRREGGGRERTLQDHREPCRPQQPGAGHGFLVLGLERPLSFALSSCPFRPLHLEHERKGEAQ